MFGFLYKFPALASEKCNLAVWNWSHHGFRSLREFATWYQSTMWPNNTAAPPRSLPAYLFFCDLFHWVCVYWPPPVKYNAASLLKSTPHCLYPLQLSTFIFPSSSSWLSTFDSLSLPPFQLTGGKLDFVCDPRSTEKMTHNIQNYPKSNVLFTLGNLHNTEPVLTGTISSVEIDHCKIH